ncbi:hypothetical protein CASFOL_036675 [Castilleja foliolosa]|uniref:14-3-3 domain-containing protein n=1 Tax=Castilleja foliolosa TaxID=1961234 RepID=A0ABD3BQY9_9LAMI
MQEELTGSYVFVCAHNNRDRRCGVCGPILIEKFKELIGSKDLQNQILVAACSHIGGHKYAGNVIIFSANPDGKVAGNWGSSSKSGVIGEASIDFSNYAETTKVSKVSLPLKCSKMEAILNVSIQRMQESFDHSHTRGRNHTIPQIRRRSANSNSKLLLFSRLAFAKLIGSAATGDSKVFYLKMRGDYHRYLADLKTGDERKEAAENTLSAYRSAQILRVRTGFVPNYQLLELHPINRGSQSDVVVGCRNRLMGAEGGDGDWAADLAVAGRDDGDARGDWKAMLNDRRLDDYLSLTSVDWNAGKNFNSFVLGSNSPEANGRRQFGDDGSDFSTSGLFVSPFSPKHRVHNGFFLSL